MVNYSAPVEDILFALKFGAGVDRLPDWDSELSAEVVEMMGRYIGNVLAPLDTLADDPGAQMVGGRVKLPEGFRAFYDGYVEAGWPSITAPVEFGGQDLPFVLGRVQAEMLSSACLGIATILTLPQGCIKTLHSHGTDEQKQACLPKLVSGEWLSTMCLTEPGAGSDLARVSTKAVSNEDGTWSLTGNKCFITAADHDLTENIVHLVLARTEGAPSGMGGLSLFVCTSVNPDGSRNKVAVTAIEEKMGLHGSPTCQVALEGATASLVGNVGEGLKNMFTMMNSERMDVALGGVGLAETARQRAWAYVQDRKQGRPQSELGANDTIAGHRDVQRMLLRMYSLALGCRAMVYDAAVTLQLDPANPALEFLTPMLKVYCTEAAQEASYLGVQTHGGYGYCRETQTEQITRDARILSIFEGTNGVLSMGVAGRLLKISATDYASAFETHVLQHAGDDRLVEHLLGLWRDATARVRQMDDVGFAAHNYVMLSGWVWFAATWQRMAQGKNAHSRPDIIEACADFTLNEAVPSATMLHDKIIANTTMPERSVFLI